MKTQCSIELKFYGGVSIDDAFADAVELANRLGCNFHFDFNGVYCEARPGSDPKTGVSEYIKAIDTKHKIAFS